jgi:meiotically up-regulated gene 157 (Mug157) protein
MTNEVREIQQELARIEKRRGTRYPKELQERVVQLVKNLQAQGHSMVAINTLLGMTGDTSARWTRNSSNEPTAFVPVEVASDSRMSSRGGN